MMKKNNFKAIICKYTFANMFEIMLDAIATTKAEVLKKMNAFREMLEGSRTIGECYQEEFFF